MILLDIRRKQDHHQTSSSDNGFMRTIIDIPDAQLRPLSEQCRKESISRAELVRRAIDLYLAQRKGEEADVFGLWRGRGTDGVDYQRSLRAEWRE